MCHSLTLRQNRHWSDLLDHAISQGALFSLPHAYAPLINQPQPPPPPPPPLHYQPQQQAHQHSKRSLGNSRDGSSGSTDVGVEGVEVTWLPPPKRRRAGKKSAVVTTNASTSITASTTASTSTTAAAAAAVTVTEREEGEVD